MNTPDDTSGRPPDGRTYPGTSKSRAWRRRTIAAQSLPHSSCGREAARVATRAALPSVAVFRLVPTANHLGADMPAQPHRQEHLSNLYAGYFLFQVRAPWEQGTATNRRLPSGIVVEPTKEITTESSCERWLETGQRFRVQAGCPAQRHGGAHWSLTARWSSSRST